MIYRYQLAALLFLCAWLSPATVNAEIFKCVAENGELTFSQAPCVEKGTTVTVMKSGGDFGGEPEECEHARRFALNTAQRMKSGVGSSTVFDGYGGIGALSKGSVSLISYVFQFRTNADVSAARVSALATAKCQARAFGDVSCEELPTSFTNRYGGCNIDEDSPELTASAKSAIISTQVAQPQSLGASTARVSSQSTVADDRAHDRERKALVEERRLECRDRVKSQIESINARLRGGYGVSQGESYKKRRRDLEAKMREC
ncbi:MAG: DUF4124 domain-containing protein [Gammaproteobacteria bacterium]|nr:DUF4124 domain-containing protein [Gammaproteobacteria bacterium]